ncbi:MAG: outer membrane beta-barrel protein [Chitinophagaceae bacterium]
MNNSFTLKLIIKTRTVKFPFAARQDFTSIKFKVGNNTLKGALSMLVLSCIAMCSFAQAYIKGRVTDGKENLPVATVLLLNKDSVLVKGVMTDNSGAFVFGNLVPGQYLVSSSMIGYSKYFSPPILVNENNIILHDITLEEASTKLDEVVVKSEKPVFEQQIDRLVINVQKSITSSGNTILEVLQKSPGIVVNRQDNSIAMNGKSGVRVMMNGKMMQLPLDVVVQMLDGMSAANVEKIELITTPPAKYDAEGNAGIIHIVTKGMADLGTNGSFGLTLGFRWAETLGANFNVNHRDKKFAYFLDYSVVRNHNLHISKMTRRSIDDGFVQTVKDDSHRENITTQQNLNAGFEWKPTNNTLLSVGITGYRRNWDMNAVNSDHNQAAVDSTVITSMKIYESNIWQSATGSIGVQTRINSKSELSFSVDYLYFHNDNPSNYDNNLLHEESGLTELSKIDLKKNTPIRVLIAKADYQYKVSSSFAWEAGIKAVRSNLDNNVLVQRLKDDIWTTDPDFTSYSNLHEEAGAIYVSTKWRAGTQWQINSGLRYEYTHTSIGTPTQKNLINRRYGYLFPGVFFKKDVDAGKDIQFSYSRRITRPTYNDIAPFVFLWGPNTFSAGNTSLYPSIADAVKAGYHAKQWIVSLQFTHSKNEISFFQPEKDSLTSNLIYRSQNLKYLNTIGMTNSFSFDITTWWKVQSNLTGQYQIAQTFHLKNNSKLNLYGLNFNLVNLIRLPKDYSIEISWMYQSKLLTGISEYLPIKLLNAGIQKKFGEKGTVRLAIDDIFYSNYWKIKTYMPQNNLDSYFSYDFHNQFVRLTYTRHFGNNKLNSVKLKSGSEEERGRVN